MMEVTPHMSFALYSVPHGGKEIRPPVRTGDGAIWGYMEGYHSNKGTRQGTKSLK